MASGTLQLGQNFGTGGGGAGVSSFNGRTGAVLPQAGDYTASQITNVPAGRITATDVQAALNQLDGTILGLYLPLAGGTMSGNINMGNNELLNVKDIAIGQSSVGAGTAIDIINSTGSTQVIQQTGYGASTGHRGKYANGTIGSPTAATSGNVLEFISARGYGTTGFAAASTGVINIRAAGTFTDASMPTDISMSTTSTGSVTAVQSLLLQPTGQLVLPKFYTTAGVLLNDASGNITSSAGPLLAVNGGTGFASFAVGDMLYAATTTTLAKLPIGTPGQNYRVDSTIPIVEDWIEPSKEVRLYDDWITTSTGDLGWSNLSTGGTATVTGAGSDTNHSGVVVLDIATGAGNTAALGLSGSTSGNALAGFLLGGGQISMEWLVNVQILATVGDDYTYRVGLSRQLGTMLDGLCFTYNRSNNVNWVAETTNASTSTLTDSGVAVAAATWVKLKIVINAAASSVQFFINGSSVATNTTNINTTNLMCPKIRMLRTAGSTAGRVIYHDYFKLYQRLTTPR